MTSAATTKPELPAAPWDVSFPSRIPVLSPSPGPADVEPALVGSGRTFPPMLQEGWVIGKVQAADELGARARKWFHGGEFVLPSHPPQWCHPRGRLSPGIPGTTLQAAAPTSLFLPPPDPGSKLLHPLSPLPIQLPTLTPSAHLGFLNYMETGGYFQGGFLFHGSSNLVVLTLVYHHIKLLIEKKNKTKRNTVAY